ncbi:hypothetical protein [Xenorhabdus griffiniae]|uniref:Phage protein n=1 Tax=Xenorhabdus griffiniae TaxID=351672 RepID=A0ABY9XFT2_9GAMM|nr:hypothetical protein [Xenorhabdus griffiniae]MBD1227711.1 hypothetical protein [Xenorhabdus griffiniae]MBE8587032.1 hypothetical protein [Xenorhabdus griffiniae]WMV71697.1 hypothetical protein QL128_16380 [Xenorhabdus griffiniae]WNH01374.1 hypothetical protein QL112_016385 [Xenorhabdus griffiniae]
MINIDNANEIGLFGHIDDGREWADWLLKKANESKKSQRIPMRFEADDTEDFDNYSMSALMKLSKEKLTEFYAIGKSLPANEYYQITGIDVARMAFELLEAREKLAEYEIGTREKDDQ